MNMAYFCAWSNPLNPYQPTAGNQLWLNNIVL